MDKLPISPGSVFLAARLIGELTEAAVRGRTVVPVLPVLTVLILCIILTQVKTAQRRLC